MSVSETSYLNRVVPKGPFGILSLQTSPLEVNLNMQNRVGISKAKKAVFTALRNGYFTILTPL